LKRVWSLKTDFKRPHRHGVFITDDGYLFSNYHVVKDATKVRLLTSAGLIDAKVVQADTANDLALLKADGRFAPLPIVPVARWLWAARWRRSVFPTSVCRGSRPRCLRTATTGEVAVGKSNFDRRMTRAIFKSAWSLQTATMQPGNWQDEHRPLVDERGNVIGIVSAKVLAHGHRVRRRRWRRAGRCRRMSITRSRAVCC
jgi:S1-C subfamily serine protease